jgi:hypothetical protein
MSAKNLRKQSILIVTFKWNDFNKVQLMLENNNHYLKRTDFEHNVKLC